MYFWNQTIKLFTFHELIHIPIPLHGHLKLLTQLICLFPISILHLISQGIWFARTSQTSTWWSPLPTRWLWSHASKNLYQESLKPLRKHDQRVRRIKKIWSTWWSPQPTSWLWSHASRNQYQESLKPLRKYDRRVRHIKAIWRPARQAPPDVRF